MLTLAFVKPIENMTVYGDDEHPNVFYVVPPRPRLRLREDGTPCMTFIAYTGKPSSSSGKSDQGGLLIFDTTFTATPEELAKVKAALEKEYKKEFQKQGLEVRVRTPQYLSGTAKLKLAMKKGNDDEWIKGGSFDCKPSLVGENIACFNVKLSEQAANVFAKAIQDSKGGIIQIEYEDLTMPVRFGAIEVKISYSTDQLRKILDDISNSGGNIEEKIEDLYEQDQMGTVDINSTLSGVEKGFKDKIEDKVTAWAQEMLTKKMESELEKVAGISEQEREKFKEKAMETKEGKWVGWLWWWYYEQPPETKSKLVQKISQISNFSCSYSARYAFDWKFSPNATLKPISEETWKKIYVPVNPEDTLDVFRKADFEVIITDDFDDLDISRVDVYIKYGKDNVKTLTFTKLSSSSSGTVNSQKFETAYQKDAGSEYTYWHKVYFKDGKGSYESSKNQGEIGVTLVIDLKSKGMLCVDVHSKVSCGKDDDEVKKVTIDIGYPDLESPSFRKTIVINEDFTGNEGQIRFPIGEFIKPKYCYQATYLLKGGTKIKLPIQETDSQRIYINNLETESRVLKGVGFDECGVTKIEVETKYKSDNSTYEKRGGPFTITKGSKGIEWRVPVIETGKGKFYYRTITRFDKASGRKRVIKPSGVDQYIEWKYGTEEVGGDKEVETRTIRILPPDSEIWEAVECFVLTLKYKDSEHDMDIERTLPADGEYDKGKIGNQKFLETWKIYIPDDVVVDDYNAIQWSVEYWLKDGSYIEQTGQGGEGNKTYNFQIPIPEADNS